MAGMTIMAGTIHTVVYGMPQYTHAHVTYGSTARLSVMVRLTYLQ